jgi:hypothetical protein
MEYNMIANIGKFIGNKLEGRGTYLSSSKLSALEEIFTKEVNRIEVAERFVSISAMLIEQSTEIVRERFLIPNSLDRMEDIDFVRNFIGLFVRYIHYAFLSGDSSILDRYILDGFHEAIIAIGHSHLWYIEALEYIKRNHGLNGKDAIELDSHIDYLIDALSPTWI